MICYIVDVRHLTTLLLLSLSLACDPNAQPPNTAQPAKPGEPTKADEQAKVGEPVKVGEPAKVAEPNFGTCVTGCAEGKASPTDRATCRLNCGVVYKAPAASPPPPLTPVANCMGACVKAGEADAACIAACRDAETAPAVLDALAVCVADCYAGAPREADDSSTCRLLCAQAAALPK